MNKTRKKIREGLKNSGRLRRGLAGAVVILLALALTGCSLLSYHPSPPKAKVNSFQLSTNSPDSVTLTVMQLNVMRFADSYVAQIAQASDDFAAQVGTPKARLAALRWKLAQATSAYTDATGVNPVVNALDMLVLVTMSRMVVEDYGVDTFGTNALPVLEVQRQLETNAWDMASTMLRPQQQEELRALIREWRQKNPHQRYDVAVRFREFVSALGRTPSTTAGNSILRLLLLDPFAGLDPTAAAIEETRELGERVMYYTQRMPQLISWQAQVLTYQLAAQPESQQVLSNADQLAASAELFAKTTQQFPQLINDQRQAGIQQLLDGLQAMGTNASQTLNVGGDAATSINGAIQSLDKFVRYVFPLNTNRPAGATNSRPFDVRDYGQAASQAGAAARDLNTLLTTVNQSTPQLAQLGQQTTADANRVVDHAFQMGLVLILVLLAGSVTAGLTYRVLKNKLAPDRRKPSTPDSGAP